MTKRNFGVTLIFTIFNKTAKFDSYLKVSLNFDDTKYRGGKISLICSVNDLNRQIQTNDYTKG
jgi:hypothetical protein